MMLSAASFGGIQVGDLVRRAMALFETDRKAAFGCLSAASTLLGPQDPDPDAPAPAVSKLKPGGLATWQAKRTLAYIEANLASKLLIDDLANVVALSRSHFSRAFKHCVGLSPMEYVVVRRIERAKAMIRSTRESLAEVALACGFADQAHLNRRFRNIVGISPGRWRRSNAPVTRATVPARAGAEVRPA
jgi:transcriptional regulator GlxA family with amidase domain